MTTTQATDKARWIEAYTKKRPEDYDQFIQWAGMNHAGALQALCQMIRAPKNAPLRVLELGTGTGILTKKVLDERPQASVLGIDGANEMLDIARRKLDGYGDRFKADCSSFEDYPWSSVAPGSYDLVISSFALHHMEHRQYLSFFGELRRILKPGGQLLVADLLLSGSEALQQHYEDIWVETRMRQTREMLGIALNKDEVMRDHKKNMNEDGDNPAVLGDLLGWLNDSGYVDVDCHWKYFCLGIYGGTKPAQ